MRYMPLCLVLLMASIAQAGDEWPQLRHTCYVALLAPEGATIQAHLKCLQHGAYADWLEYSVIDCDGDEVGWGQLPPGEDEAVRVQVDKPGLHLIEMSSGWNLSVCSVANVPYAFIATERIPLQTVGSAQRLFFFVPPGEKEFSAFVSSSVTGEGVRLALCGPDGKEVQVVDGDVDKLERIKVNVPAQHSGKAWSLTLTKPAGPGLNLDDAMLYLSENIPPFLAEQAQWAEQFSKWEEQ